MYIKINDIKYDNISRTKNSVIDNIVYTGESLKNIKEISDSIEVYRNDGFLMYKDFLADYSRYFIGEGIITLTNEPEYFEPEMSTEEAFPKPNLEERIIAIEQENALLKKQLAATEDALCEIDSVNEERIAAIEDALCEIDMGGNV